MKKLVKFCPVCKKFKLLTDFHKSKNRARGVDGYCKFCKNIKQRLYRKQHPEKMRNYYQKNKKRLLKNINKYYKLHKKIIYKKRRIYALLAKGIYSHLQAQAKIKKIFFKISKEDFCNWYNKQKQICYYCKRTLKETKRNNSKYDLKPERLSIDRKNNDKGYILDNIVLACMRCNNVKNWQNN